MGLIEDSSMVIVWYEGEDWTIIESSSRLNLGVDRILSSSSIISSRIGHGGTANSTLIDSRTGFCLLSWIRIMKCFLIPIRDLEGKLLAALIMLRSHEAILVKSSGVYRVLAWF